MTDKRGFRERLIAARSERGWSQQALAEAAGVAAAQISRYESGRSDPRPEVIARLSSALGTTFEWLAEGRSFSDMANTVDERGERLVRISATLPQWMLAALTAEAEQVGRSLTAEMRERLLATLQPSELDLPDGLRERLKASADASGRTMNAEVVARLEASYESDRAGSSEALMLEMRRTQLHLELNTLKQELGQLYLEGKEVQARAQGSVAGDELDEIEALLADIGRRRKDFDQRSARLLSRLAEVDSLLDLRREADGVRTRAMSGMLEEIHENIAGQELAKPRTRKPKP